MRAIVTGSRGFIGGNLRKELVKIGFFVIEIDDDFFKSENWESELIAQVKLAKPDAIFHVGACSDTLENRVQFIMERNFESTKLLAEVSNSLQIPFIYSSSAANYGVNGRVPSNLYGWSKYVGESIVSAHGGVSLRYFNVYGPGEADKNHMASFFLQSFLSHKKGAESKLFPGFPKRDFIYIMDVVKANIQALNSYNEIKGGIFDVGTSSPRTFEEALQIMGLPFSYGSENDIPHGYQFYTCANVEKWLPNWKPEYTLELGLATYLEELNKKDIRN